MIKNLKNTIKNNWLIIIILLISITLHILSFNELGYNYSLINNWCGREEKCNIF